MNIMSQNDKAKHIQTMLNQLDIEGLLANGAPDDEYESEALALCSLTHQIHTFESALTHITHIWQQSFNLSAAELTKRTPSFETLAHWLVSTQS